MRKFLTEEWNTQKAATMLPRMDYSTQVFHLSLPLSCFCSSKRTLSIYTPHFFQMLKILIQAWKSKLNALWCVLLTSCFIADVSEPQQWNELPAVIQDLQRMEWKPLWFPVFHTATSISSTNPASHSLGKDLWCLLQRWTQNSDH